MLAGTIHPGLRRCIPVFLNPLIRFTAVMDIGQAWDIILGMSAVVGTSHQCIQCFTHMMFETAEYSHI